MIVVDVEQNTHEWSALKLGVPSASRFGEIVKANGERSESRNKYLYELAEERILGFKKQGYNNKDMEWGHKYEPEAASVYAFIHGVEFHQPCVCYKDEAKRFLCSPDRLIIGGGGFEAKCPHLITHDSYVDGGVLPAKYHRQVQGSLYITDLPWWDFESYFPTQEPFIVRVYPDLEFHQKLGKELNMFCDELDERVARKAA